nr:MAG: hypothetical protein [Bacteriophage sp.]
MEVKSGEGEGTVVVAGVSRQVEGVGKEVLN